MITIADQSTFGGFVVMTGDGAATLRIPFYGWKGDYQKLNPIVDLTIGPSWQQPVCMGLLLACTSYIQLQHQ